MISSNTRFRQSLEVGRQQRLAQDIARLQAQISGRTRILAPSDDPVGAGRVAEISRLQGTEKSYAGNVDIAAALSGRADTVLGSLTTLFDRAKELMLTARTGTTSPESRATIAIELGSIADEIVAISNTPDLRGGALFASGEALSIPVAAGIEVAPVETRERVFNLSAGGAEVTSLEAIVRNAALAITEADPELRESRTIASLDQMDLATAHVTNIRAEQGLRAQRLDAYGDRLQESGLQLTEERSLIEDTDVAEAIARVQSKDLSLKASQAIYSQLSQRTLFDLIR